MQIHCFKAIISGRVQGVFFRDSTRQQARQLNLSGYARNLADGTVEVIACGEEEALLQLELWLQQGPPQSRVDRVRLNPIDPPEGLDGFSVL